jgi:hypothetical protein
MGNLWEAMSPEQAEAKPSDGRVYVAISKPDGRGTPISSASETGSPLFGVNVVGLAPGATAVIDQTTFGAPVRSFRDIPAGDYMIQPFVNVYTKFDRADGHTVWLHMDQWEGQNWKRSPGNLFGDPVKIHFDPASSAPIALVADKINPPVQAPADTDMVKRIKIQSQILTKWWGQPIYLGAVILLPKDYDKHPDVKYPVIYDEGHFSLGAPGGFGGRGRGGRGGGDAAPGGGFTGYWQADGTPRMIMVTLQHPSPYYDDSYGVNSENNGPYGDAIMKELIPAVETQFRAFANRGRACSPADPPGAGSHSRIRSSIPISTAAPGRSALTQPTSATIRSSTSTMTPTPISWIATG